jgi:hypothetical protein
VECCNQGFGFWVCTSALQPGQAKSLADQHSFPQQENLFPRNIQACRTVVRLCAVGTLGIMPTHSMCSYTGSMVKLWHAFVAILHKFSTQLDRLQHTALHSQSKSDPKDPSCPTHMLLFAKSFIQHSPRSMPTIEPNYMTLAYPGVRPTCTHNLCHGKAALWSSHLS